MNNISKIKRELEIKYARHFCNISDIDKCPKKECTCRIAAEIKAYILSIIPDTVSKLTLDDLTGYNGIERLLPIEVALKAKQLVLSYCWKGVSLNDLSVGPNKLSQLSLDRLSIMDERRENGDNVVIYASSSRNKPQEMGKSFVASLVMREAIKRRAFPGHYGDTYDWISFGLLKGRLIQRNTGDKDVSISDTQFSDWLVVDDICDDFASSVRGQNFVSSLLDPFFFERMQDGLPTILVFKFDIMQPSINLEQSFGVAVNKIAHDPKTCIISLCHDHR